MAGQRFFDIKNVLREVGREGGMPTLRNPTHPLKLPTLHPLWRGWVGAVGGQVWGRGSRGGQAVGGRGCGGMYVD